jgi:hypothetical protein
LFASRIPYKLPYTRETAAKQTGPPQQVCSNLSVDSFVSCAGQGLCASGRTYDIDAAGRSSIPLTPLILG